MSTVKGLLFVSAKVSHLIISTNGPNAIFVAPSLIEMTDMKTMYEESMVQNRNAKDVILKDTKMS